MARTSSMKQAIRVLEHAARITIRTASNSTSTTTTGRLAQELGDYVKLLTRLQEQGRPEEFFRVLRNAQMKLVKLIAEITR